MQDSTFELTFCEKYNLVADEYDGIAVTTLPFSVRVINRFMGNGISTVAALLKSSPSTLMKIKGFGANCLEEVDAYCSKLNENDFKPVEQDFNVSKCVSPLFYKHREDIALGNFSVFENYELSDDESKMLQRYQEAYGILGVESIKLPIEIDKASLSYGEKQIFIMALYHSLVSLCSHELPFVIDTPFARIDTEHRQNISKHFFSKLNGQVFILSTNEEINSSHVKILEDKIAATYMLENTDNKRTVVLKNSYFEV